MQLDPCVKVSQEPRCRSNSPSKERRLKAAEVIFTKMNVGNGESTSESSSSSSSSKIYNNDNDKTTSGLELPIFCLPNIHFLWTIIENNSGRRERKTQ